jgi:cytochrome c553
MTLTGVWVQRARRITAQPLWWLALPLKSKSLASRYGAAVMMLALSVMTSWSLAEAEINEPRAKYHYQMFCQGCHTPDGSGVNAVPPLKGMMGVFLRSQRGREFMVQVPGSATSKLKDAQLAEVLNWCIENFAGSSLINGEYRPYTADEVGRLRQSPLQEIDHTRAAVLAEIARLPETGEI